MDKNSILEFNNKESVSDVLNELLRSGAQKLIHNAVEAELREFMSQHQGVTEDGKVSVIRNDKFNLLLLRFPLPTPRIMVNLC